VRAKEEAETKARNLEALKAKRDAKRQEVERRKEDPRPPAPAPGPAPAPAGIPSVPPLAAVTAPSIPPSIDVTPSTPARVRATSPRTSRTPPSMRPPSSLSPSPATLKSSSPSPSKPSPARPAPASPRVGSATTPTKPTAKPLGPARPAPDPGSPSDLAEEAPAPPPKPVAQAPAAAKAKSRPTNGRVTFQQSDSPSAAPAKPAPKPVAPSAPVPPSPSSAPTDPSPTPKAPAREEPPVEEVSDPVVPTPSLERPITAASTPESLLSTISPEQLIKFREAFSLFDKDGDGTVSVRELESVMRTLGHQPTEAQLRDMIRDVDCDANGAIDFAEFVYLMCERIDSTDGHLRFAFSVFDTDRTGKIYPRNLRQGFSILGQTFTEEQCAAMIRAAALNGEEFVRFRAFKEMMTVKD